MICPKLITMHIHAENGNYVVRICVYRRVPIHEKYKEYLLDTHVYIIYIVLIYTYIQAQSRIECLQVYYRCM